MRSLLGCRTKMLRRRIYYEVKPYLPWRLRNWLRRITATSQREAAAAIWPIHESAGRRPANWKGWPDGKRFAFVLTHDVEGREGLAKCKKLAELEIANGVRSSFNFVPEGDYSVSQEFRSWLVSNGFEVGVHDLVHDGRLYFSRNLFHKNAKGINSYLGDWNAEGFRAGFMLRELDWIHELDIAYDASTFDTDPFEPQPDAAGTIFPFWVPAPNDLPLRPGYIELPYSLPQDSTLFLLFREPSPEIWCRKLDWVAEHGGMAMVIVHPDYLQFPGDPPSPRTYPVDHYIKLLDHVRSRHSGTFWQPLPKDVAHYAAQVRPSHEIRAQKRICILTYSFFEQDSRVYRYAHALAERGDEVTVYSLRSSPDQAVEEVVDGCLVVRLQLRKRDEKSPAMFLGRLLRFLWLSSCKITRRQWIRPFDLVHIHNVPDFLVFAAWLPKLQGAKIILDIHDIVPELFASKFAFKPGSLTIRLLKWMERASAAFAHQVILANDLWVESYTSRSAPKRKVSVLINYVDSKIFAARPRTRKDDRKIVIFPGSLQLHQGLDVAIDAFPSVVAELPAAELHIYGDGPAKSALVKQAETLGLNGHVKFFDFVPTKDIAAIIADADLGVVPKRADSFGNEAFSTKIFEFMALGIPVVASSTKIDRYYFNDSVLRFFESGDSAALAREIVALLKNPEMAGQMARRASVHAAANTWESRKTEYLGLVDRLCSSAK
jgi:glycosyltransferase involved in cell wall biosynthesis